MGVTTASPLELLKQADRLVQSAVNYLERGSDAHDYADVALDHVRDAIRAFERDAIEAEEAQEPGSEAAYRRGCTCRARAVRPTDIDPPDIRRNRNCPLHGIDPDRARDERRDA